MARYAFHAANLQQQDAETVNTISADLHQSALERDFPRVLDAIQAMWGHRELNAYFRKLTMDERGNRAGFPPEVWDDIYTLLYLHQEIVREPLF